jgi:hypothetical protein
MDGFVKEFQSMKKKIGQNYSFLFFASEEGAFIKCSMIGKVIIAIK